MTPLVTTENQLRMAVLNLQRTYGFHAAGVCHDQEVFLIQDFDLSHSRSALQRWEGD